MDVLNYITRMKMIYSSFLGYVENDNDTPEKYQEFIQIIKNQIGENSDELKALLHIIHKVSNHHKRNSIFNNKRLFFYSI